MEKKLHNVYYSAGAHWKGIAAIDKLAEAAKVSKSTAQEWLVKQPVWQIYLPAPKYIPRPKIDVAIPNAVHQADLLFLPHDTLIKDKRRETYKYALVVVDVATRYGDAEPLTSKYSAEVATALSKIYKRKPLKFPEIMQVDEGKEFKGAVSALLSKNNVKIHLGIPDVHRNQAIVERRNKEIAERLFSNQYVEELKNPEKRSTRWVEELKPVVKAINNTTTALIGMKPVEAMKLTNVSSTPATASRSSGSYKRPVGEDEKTLPRDVSVRYLYESGELEGGKKRATDPIWSLETYKIDRVITLPKQPKVYFLHGGPRRSFVREELLVVPTS